jgi:serine/threonine-protein kinase RsbW
MIEEGPRNKFEGDEWTLDSKKEEAIEAADEVSRRLIALGWDQEDTFRFQMAVAEAIANAIIHGNKEDPSKKVQVKINATKDSVSIGVKDEGEGFRREDIPDSTTEEGVVRSSGRGVFLIEKLSDEFHISGNEVLFVKRNPAQEKLKTKPAS